MMGFQLLAPVFMHIINRVLSLPYRTQKMCFMAKLVHCPLTQYRTSQQTSTCRCVLQRHADNCIACTGLIQASFWKNNTAEISLVPFLDSSLAIIENNMILWPRTNVNKTYTYLRQGGSEMHQVTVKIRQLVDEEI